MKTKILTIIAFFILVELFFMFVLPCPCKAQGNDTIFFNFRECYWQFPEINSVDTTVQPDGTVVIVRLENFHPPYFTRLLVKQPSRVKSMDGQIFVEAEPGSGKNLKYSFSNGAMSNTADMLSGGRYTARVIDENGCSDSIPHIDLFYFLATPISGGLAIEYYGNDESWMSQAGEYATITVSDITGKIWRRFSIYLGQYSDRYNIDLPFTGIVIVKFETGIGSVSLKRIISQD